MEEDLEKRWQKACEVKQTGKIEEGVAPKGMELLYEVTDSDYKGTASDNYNEQIAEAIKKDKAEAEKRYNITIKPTAILCNQCGSPLTGEEHPCTGKRPITIPRLPRIESSSPREWKWCPSREQQVCDEICLNAIHTEKCIKTKSGCKVKPKPMSEEAKARLRAYTKPKKTKPISVETKPILVEEDELLKKVKEFKAQKISALLYQEKIDRKGVKLPPF